LFIFEPLVNGIGFGLKVKGRKNLKTIKHSGAISVSNHVHYIDNLMIRQAVYPKKDFYVTVAPHNCKKGFGGYTMRAGGILPFSADSVAKQHMAEAIHTLMQKKKLVHVYAEKALWFRYEKPRPHKSGAYHFAFTENVPVLPIYICWRENKSFESCWD
jgi:1-acyl-sn-glycerol-3-phosphate acyltransferase